MGQIKISNPNLFIFALKLKRRKDFHDDSRTCHRLPKGQHLHTVEVLQDFWILKFPWLNITDLQSKQSWVIKKKDSFEDVRSQIHPETGCFCKLARFLTNPEYAFKRTCQNSWCIDHFQSKTSFFTLCMALIWEDSNRKLLSISKLRKWTYQRSLQKLIVFFAFCKQFNYRFILKVPRCSYILWIILSYLRVSA